MVHLNHPSPTSRNPLPHANRSQLTSASGAFRVYLGYGLRNLHPSRSLDLHRQPVLSLLACDPEG